MRIRASVQGAEIDAYIVTSFDEHQTERTAADDRRREFITGFTGDQGVAVVTLRSAAVWVDGRFGEQADRELSCDWLIFKIDERPSIPEWLASQQPPDSRIGADPHLVPHYLWQEWDRELSKNFLKLVKVNKNLIDMIWTNRPLPGTYSLKVQPVKYAGEKWEAKVQTLRNSFMSIRCDAMVVTSLTEIAYLLNLRGNDIPYIPVFKSYMIVSSKEVILYTNKTKTSVGTNLHLKSEPCSTGDCVQ
jgi:Xaa-Pro aminopeptidase